MENLFYGLTLDQLVVLEMEIDQMKLNSYQPIGMMSESDNVSDYEYSQLEKSASTLDKMFAKIDSALASAIELASSRERTLIF